MELRAATFIGHGNCMELSQAILEDAVEAIIKEGYKVFLNGGMGQFDLKCAGCLSRLKRRYADIQSILVIPYLSYRVVQPELFDEIIHPEELDNCHYKTAILKRNRYLVDHSEIALCYVNHNWGGAAKTCAYAYRKGKHIVNLGSMRF